MITDIKNNVCSIRLRQVNKFVLTGSFAFQNDKFLALQDAKQIYNSSILE